MSTVPPPDPGFASAPDGDPLRATTADPPPGSTPFALSFSTFEWDELPTVFDAPATAISAPAVPNGASGALAFPEGATTNRPANSASGITGAGSRGTLTALRTTTAFGIFSAGSAGVIGAGSPGKLRSAAPAIFGAACSAGPAEDCLGAPMDNTGPCTRGTVAWNGTNPTGLGTAGCSSCGTNHAQAVAP